ncbi:MAG: hypothetical protein VZQ47_09125 [Treponema sp.]|nr:hypothetical protein [Treponema sp.]MEE3435705.1 hypothetical protein [Treponema sp.]
MAEKMSDKKKAAIASAAASSGQSTVGLRIGAVALWLLAIVCEFVALGTITESVIIPFLTSVPPLYQGLAFLAIDLVLVIIGAQLWKKANHIKPASEKNAVIFWLWNNMGVIVCAIAFLPFVVLLLKNEKADQKTKTVGTVAAIIALLIAGVASYDFNPISAEQVEQYTNSTVYWTEYGSRLHTHNDCQALSRTAPENLHSGTISEAEAAGRSTLCKYCEKRDQSLIVQMPDNKQDLPAAANE